MRSRFTLVFVCLAFFAFAQREQAYLQTHAAIWNSHGFRHMDKVFDKNLLNSQLFLIGESHGVQYTHELEFDLVKYLKKKTGFRYLLLELGFLDEIYLNRYLQTGNEKVLDSFFRFHASTFYYNKSEEKFFRDLYSLNSSLPVHQRFRVLAIDLEFAHRDAIAYLQREKFSILPPELKMLVESIHVLTDSSAALIKKFNVAYDHFINNEQLFKKYLGSDYDEVDHMLGNIQKRLHIAITGNAVLRDTVMLQNFQWNLKKHGIGKDKMVGIMGSFHVKQADDPSDPKFGALVKKNNLVSGLVSLVLGYHEGEVMMPARNFPDANDAPGKMFVNRPNGNGIWSLPMKQWELLDPFFMKNKAWLFRLDNKDSPFHTSTAFTTKQDEPYFTTELFQVFVLVNNSPATQSYE